jgi:hypothetical protein
MKKRADADTSHRLHKSEKTQQKRKKEIPWHLFYKPDRPSEGSGEIASGCTIHK